MKPWLAPLLLLGVGCWQACAAQGAKPAAEDADFDRTPKDCISTTRIIRTEVLDERTILFHMGGRQVYRNTLPRTCRGLNAHDPFMYEPRSMAHRLCENDFIELLERFGSSYERGRACGLGKFYPLTPEDVADLKRTAPSEVTAEPVPAPDEDRENEPAKNDDSARAAPAETAPASAEGETAPPEGGAP